MPYAAIFGNHDDEGDSSRDELMEVLTELPYSLAKPGLKGVDGVGNYVVLIEKPGSVSPTRELLIIAIETLLSDSGFSILTSILQMNESILDTIGSKKVK